MSTFSDLHNTPRLKQIYDQRVQILKLIREFFWSKDFIETDTPVALRFPGQEPYLNPLHTTIHDPNGHAHQFYLQTSPEFAMKKLLAAGYSKIFQMCKCFRDFESFGGNHNTEFTMIEWYRSPGSLSDIMTDTENLFKFIADKLKITALNYHNQKIEINVPWTKISMKNLWQQTLGVNLDDFLTTESLRGFVASKNYSPVSNDTYEDLFFKIFLNEIEPTLGSTIPTFVFDYPAQMCSLSRFCSHDPRYAERFELYLGGLEIANAFGELIDPTEQKNRLENDKSLRTKLNKPTWPVDHDFINALNYLNKKNHKSIAGIALGIDRMVLLFTEAHDLNEVVFQSVSDQINI